MTTEMGTYITELQIAFREYRDLRFAGKYDLFGVHKGGAVVFKPDHVENNLLFPPCISSEQRTIIIRQIPRAKRHKHFGSMQSSQALTQSVFGVIAALNRLPLLSSIKSEDGLPAFGPILSQTNLHFEKEICTLGEKPGGRTSVDVWLESAYCVAIECKLAEAEFGSCSRPRLKKSDIRFEAQHCDGTYTRQRGRTERCALTHIGVRYWKHLGDLFGWSHDIDHPICPLNKTYQLVRNVLAACVDEHENLRTDRGHALIIYDQRNPAMAKDGAGDVAWRKTYEALKANGILRRLSWQAFIAQWPSDQILGWLKDEVGKKYGLRPS